MPTDPNFPTEITTHSFYEGLYGEEALSLVGSQMCYVNTEEGIASYEKYVPKQCNTHYEDSLNGFLIEHTAVELESRFEKAPYQFRSTRSKKIDEWLAPYVFDLGRNTGIKSESALIHLVLKECKPVSFAGGSSRESVSEPISWSNIHNIKAHFDQQRAPRISQVLRQGPSYGFSRIQSVECFTLFAHPNVLSDIRENNGFEHSSEYTSSIGLNEYGRINDVRIIKSPNMPVYRGIGVHTDETQIALESTENRVDVYPIIFSCAQAWGCAPLRRYTDVYEPTLIHRWNGEEGYVEVNYCDAFAIQNPAWIKVFEVGVKQSNP